MAIGNNDLRYVPRVLVIFLGAKYMPVRGTTSTPDASLNRSAFRCILPAD